MSDFKKMYNLKMVSIIMAVSLFVTSIGYGIDLSQKRHIRVPISDGREREKNTMSRLEFIKSFFRRKHLEEPEGVQAKSSKWVDVINKTMHRRKFILYSGAGIGILVVGLVVRTVVDRINFFSYDKLLSQLEAEKVKDKLEAGAFDLKNLLRGLNLIKYKKMTSYEAIQLCNELKDILERYPGTEYYPINSKAHIEQLINFLIKEDINGINSVSVKWKINDLKIEIISILTCMIVPHSLRSPTLSLQNVRSIITALGSLIKYNDNFKGVDEIYDKYFPTVDSMVLLNDEIRDRAYKSLEVVKSQPYLDSAIRDRLNQLAECELEKRIMSPVGNRDIFRAVRELFRFYGTPEEIEQACLDIERIENESVHFISENDKCYIEEIRKLPRDIAKYCVESAKEHNIPPRLLIASMMGTYLINNFKEHRYSIRQDLEILRNRKRKTKIYSYLERILPDWVLRWSPGLKLNDFIGGVICGGKATMGIIQMRPAWVRRTQGWKRFGINTEDMSDSEISWKLLGPDSKLILEAAAVFWRFLIDDVEKIRQEALLYNATPDFEERYKDESAHEKGGISAAAVTNEYFKSIPSPKAFGKNKWMITIYNPQYGNWSVLRLKWHKLIAQSGIFDGKPVVFVSDSELENIKKQRSAQRGIVGGV